ncbi:amidohydrolase family protein [Oceanicaulis sp. LC35]|uniref:amidohydrolase family protein n=1 Tax=Oceanicaulis sp. LC35 TaxID=3349635 RepID=UPI003F866E2C
MRLLQAAFGLAFLNASFLTGLAQAQEPRTDSYVVIAAGENVGYLHATTNGDQVGIEYDVDNNGRGAGNQQSLTLNADGIPVSWTIEGHSLFGDPVHETMSQSDGQLEWNSQSDSGVIEVSEPRLYIAADGSPWSAGMYVRAVLATGKSALPVAPAGELQVEAVPLEAPIEGLEDATVYRLTGLNLGASYVVMDEDLRLIASISGMTILEEYAELAPQLAELSAGFEVRHQEELQDQLAHEFESPVVIRNVRIFDPEAGALTGLSAVTVFQGEIVGVQPDATVWIGEDHQIIDGEGGVLVPGLHDMHAHINSGTGLRYLSAGVTSVRDMGNDPEGLIRLINRIEAGELAGPRTVPNGMLEGRSPYSVRTGIIADTLDNALEAVRWYASHGYWQVKIYNSLPGDWIAPVIAEAHAWGLGVTGHVPAFVSPDYVIEAGYDDISHINQLMLGWLLEADEDTRTPIRLTGMRRAAMLDLNSDEVQHTVDLMVEHGTALDTTAVTLELLMLSRSGEFPSAAAGHVEHMPIGFQRNRRRAFVTVDSEETDAEYRNGFQSLLDTMKLLDDRGVQLLPGTDSSFGFPALREVELYVQAGISPARALALATLEAERYLGREAMLGSIEIGKRADFFLIPNDPLENISNIREIRLVMKDGVAYLPAEIHRALGIQPFAEPVALPEPVQ